MDGPKLTFEQRQQAEVLVDRMMDEPEELAFEVIAERDALRARVAELERQEGFAVRLLSSSMCKQHQDRARSQSAREFVAEHEGKCLLCFEAEGVKLQRELAAAREQVRNLREGLQFMLDRSGEWIPRGFVMQAAQAHDDAARAAKEER